MAKQADPRYPDIHPTMLVTECYDRESFRVNERTFKRVEPGQYTDGKVTVYCDQQCSTAWAARQGNLRTGYYNAPEFAVSALVESL